MVTRSTDSGAILPVDINRYSAAKTLHELRSTSTEYRVSVLGPLLFVLYTSDVARVINECGLLSVVYADDTQIRIQVEQRDISPAKVRVEECIAKIKQWLACNRLRQNPSKTEIM